MAVDAPTTFWEPIRRTIIENLLGYLPHVNTHGLIVSPPSAVTEMPVVTYIVRQGGSRQLTEQDHEGLVNALKELERSGVCQVHVVQMEKMSLEQQVEIMARTTVRIISLPPAAGPLHYAVWNDTLTTFPKGEYFKGVKYSSDFHGRAIPVYGPAIVQVIRERLSGGLPKP
ncbi:hypothetical protein DXG03_001643 [Asterophora parasitica]|uniref:Uncharacterized protein n=1 Tax=Asterophora parasitica TaxID=117018 RepID=A0A9P7K938_9AGAR|nr:hypothetical protein DXG03_001643 [Asterophora parasitica]